MRICLFLQVHVCRMHMWLSILEALYIDEMGGLGGKYLYL